MTITLRPRSEPFASARSMKKRQNARCASRTTRPAAQNVITAPRETSPDFHMNSQPLSRKKVAHQIQITLLTWTFQSRSWVGL